MATRALETIDPITFTVLRNGFRAMCSQVTALSSASTVRVHSSQGRNLSSAACPYQLATASAKPRRVTAASETTKKLSPFATSGRSIARANAWATSAECT